jgi:EAL domain-containing protein (putative c-di-GMP-specific phosphodiesterase class I)
MIDLTHALDMKVIAEGVETAGQLARLRDMGCDLAQGNYFSEPLPARALRVLLKDTLGDRG